MKRCRSHFSRSWKISGRSEREERNSFLTAPYTHAREFLMFSLQGQLLCLTLETFCYRQNQSSSASLISGFSQSPLQGDRAKQPASLLRQTR
ncbi:hypothetical protein VTO42DRAFT_6938 [Malbranchea cinnamomea]